MSKCEILTDQPEANKDKASSIDVFFDLYTNKCDEIQDPIA